MQFLTRYASWKCIKGTPKTLYKLSSSCVCLRKTVYLGNHLLPCLCILSPPVEEGNNAEEVGIKETIVFVTISALIIAIYKCLKMEIGLLIGLLVGIPIMVVIGVVTALCFVIPPGSSSPGSPTKEMYPVIRDWQVKGATMERFFLEIAREKPLRFSPQQLAAITQGYSTILGSGGFGDVYKGEFDDGIKVAVKVIKQNSDKRVQEQFMAEIGTIGRTYHINLVRLYGFCFDPLMRALVYEYMENSSLDKLLFEGNRTIEWGKLHEIAIGTAKGISYLHEGCEKRIIHYDIKPANVLLDANFNPKVADFGLAKLCNIGSSQVTLTGCRGTPGYVAPELWMPYPATHKCDVYSFGVLLFEIVGRRKSVDPSVSETQEWLPRWTWNMYEKVELPEMVGICGIEEKDREKAERMCIVALWCVQYLPGARPNMSTVVKMLEGEMEIASPPNPFKHLESNGLQAFASEGDYTDSDLTTSDLQNSNNVGRKPEPEIVSIYE